jgi:FimV-like protein
VSRRHAGAAGALLGAAALGCAGPPQVDLRGAVLDGWLELRSPHFVLTGDVSRAEVERFAEDLALFVAVIERITNATVDRSRVPARIYLVHGAIEDALIPSRSVLGYMVPRLDGYYGVVGRSNLAPLTRETLLHEYAHFLIRTGAALDYPIWYDEGFAEVVSTTHRRDDLVTVGTPLAGRLYSLARTGRIDLEAVLAPRQRADIDDPGLFYATAWALTHYLATHGETIGRMGRLVELQARGVDWREAYAQAFPDPLEDLSRAVRRHVDALARGALASVAMFDAGELRVRRDFAVRELAPLELARELGELSLAVFDDEDRGATAAAFFERALEIDPGDARSRAGLAVAHAMQGRSASAIADIASVSAMLPDDTAVLLAAGRVHRILAATDGDPPTAAEQRLAARAVYRRATQLDPRNPSGWAGLGWSYVGGGDPAPGIDALTRAQATGAWDAGVSLDLGRLYRKAGDERRARELWMQVARLGDEDQVEEARRLLEDVAGDPAR